MIKPKVWTKMHCEALEGFMQGMGDADEVAQRFGGLYGFDQAEVLFQMELLNKNEPDARTIEAGIEATTRFALGLCRKLNQAQKRLLAQLTGVIHDALNIKAAPVDVPLVSSKLESLVLQLSDWHFGKQVTKDDKIIFNIEIAKERVQILIEHVVELLAQHLQKDFAELVILIGGDMVDGADIYGGQAYHQDITVPYQVKEAAMEIWKLILALRPYFPQVRVVAVRGNHGRQSKTAPDNSNFDIMVYQQLAMAQNIGAQLPNLTIQYTLEQSTDIMVQGKKIHLRHEAPQQAETAAASNKYSGWKNIHAYEIVCSGHFHTHGWSEVFGKPVFKCGSLVGPDDLADRMAKYSDPAQLMFTVPPKPYPIVGSVYKIHLERTSRKEEVIGEQGCNFI